MAWIESHQSMAAHPKTRVAARELGISRAALIGHLHMLWWWALDYAPDGDLSGYNVLDIADAADWEGDSEAFVQALTDCGRGGRPGYLETSTDGRMVIHDWMEYAGKLVERREANAQRMREKRAAHVQRTCEPCTGATVPTNQQYQPTVPTNLSSSVPDESPIAAKVREVWEYYREHIQPKASVCPDAKIRTRLKRFTTEQLKDAIDHFRNAYWWMSRNAKQGGKWFFESDDRIDQFLLLEPETQEQCEARERPSTQGGGYGTSNGYSQRNHI